MRTRTVGHLREGARRVLAHVSLEQVYVINSEYRTLNRDLEPPFRVDTELRVMGTQVAGGVEVWVRYLTEAFKDNEPAEAEGIWLAALEYIATFGPVGDELAEHSDDDLEAFAMLVGTPAIHPYAREHTQAMTSRSQYPAFTLGLLNSLAELPEDYEVELPDRG